MNPEQLRIYLDRCDSILQSVRLQNSGSDAHTIGDIRNTATMLKDQLETDSDCLKPELIEMIIKNTEKKVVDFYRKKYWNISKNSRDML